MAPVLLCVRVRQQCTSGWRTDPANSGQGTEGGTFHGHHQGRSDLTSMNAHLENWEKWAGRARLESGTPTSALE